MKAKIAGMHDIVENKDGELMLVIFAHEGQPEEPELFIEANEDRAFLRRRADDWVDLPAMHTEGAAKVRAAGSLLVTEVSEGDSEKIIRTYRVDVRSIARN